MLIYKIVNLVNGKLYIGQTVKSLQQRWVRHLYLVRSGENRYLYDSIRYYGVENFLIEEIEKCDSKEVLNEREKFWIKYFKSNNKDFGYNMNDGGTGGAQSPEICKIIASKKRGIPLSDETKQKISNAHKGKTHTKEHNENVSKANKGKKLSEENVQKIKSRMIGKKSPMDGKNHSDETKQKLSLFWKGKSLKERLGEEGAAKNIEMNRKRFIENNPLYKHVDKDELESLLMQNILLVDIAKHFNVTYATIINKIKKYWNLVGVDEFRRKFLGTNPTKHRKRKPYNKNTDYGEI